MSRIICIQPAGEPRGALQESISLPHMWRADGLLVAVRQGSTRAKVGCITFVFPPHMSQHRLYFRNPTVIFHQPPASVSAEEAQCSLDELIPAAQCAVSMWSWTLLKNFVSS